MAEEQEETFASFITAQYRKGHLNDQATAAFRAVVDAVVMTRKAGQIRGHHRHQAREGRGPPERVGQGDIEGARV